MLYQCFQYNVVNVEFTTIFAVFEKHFFQIDLSPAQEQPEFVAIFKENNVAALVTFPITWCQRDGDFARVGTVLLSYRVET